MSKQNVYIQLNAFLKKFYTNEILRGLLLFVGFSLLYFLTSSLLEYYLWLPSWSRGLLLFGFILLSVYLFVVFLLLPVLKLFQLKKGLSYIQASVLIQKHFPEIKDQLLNFLQLDATSQTSELLQASIDQKATQLAVFSFSDAVNFKSNLRFVPLTFFPLLVLFIILFSGQANILRDGFSRVVSYSESFSPPPPFEFILLNDDLNVASNADITLKVQLKGVKIPDEVYLDFGNDLQLMQKVDTASIFYYKLNRLQTAVDFRFKASDFYSSMHRLHVRTTPSVKDMSIELLFPPHTRRSKEIVRGNGSIMVPEGTTISWNIVAPHTDQIRFLDNDVSAFFTKKDANFVYARRALQPFTYQLQTSNLYFKPFETFTYTVDVIRDQMPIINVEDVNDVQFETLLHKIEISDDYGLKQFSLKYYAKNNPQQVLSLPFQIKNPLSDAHVYMFPKGLSLESGLDYEYYFEVIDNDAVNNYKTVRSKVYSTRILSKEEELAKSLQKNSEATQGIEHSLRQQETLDRDFKNLQQKHKTSKQLTFKDQQKLQDFLEKQKVQDEMLKNFTKDLKKNLDQINDTNDPRKEALEQRLEEAEKRLDKDKNLWEELERLNQQMQDENLMEKLDKNQASQQSKKRNLEQLVELTKRFIVEKRAQKIADALDKLAEKQAKLSQETPNADKQNEVNKEFEQISKELDKLKKENEDLKSPMDLPNTQPQQEAVEKDLNNAKDDISKQKSPKENQKKAADKMKQMSMQLGQSMMQMQGEQMQEDIALLRQILDNLLAFSFDQEQLMKQFSTVKRGAPSYNFLLIRQQNLKTNFNHIDDSLFALSMRNPAITSKIHDEIGQIYYNTNKSIDELVEANISKGVSHQQYVMSATNRLADMLSSVLNSMQMSMSSSGSGSPSSKPGDSKGSQLPDIIQQQSGLSEKMKEGMKGKSDGKGKEKGEGQQKGQGQGEGSTGDGESDGDGEQQAKLLMEIFKEQRRLREQLENELKKSGVSPDAKRIVEDMKQNEKDILNKGFSQAVLNRMIDIKYKMLKLSDALLQQEEDNKRTAEQAKRDFNNSSGTLSPELQQFLQNFELLNRHTLPLQPFYHKKSQTYFNP